MERAHSLSDSPTNHNDATDGTPVSILDLPPGDSLPESPLPSPKDDPVSSESGSLNHSGSSSLPPPADDPPSESDGAVDAFSQGNNEPIPMPESETDTGAEGDMDGALEDTESEFEGNSVAQGGQTNQEPFDDSVEEDVNESIAIEENDGVDDEKSVPVEIEEEEVEHSVEDVELVDDVPEGDVIDDEEEKGVEGEKEEASPMQHLVEKSSVLTENGVQDGDVELRVEDTNGPVDDVNNGDEPDAEHEADKVEEASVVEVDVEETASASEMPEDHDGDGDGDGEEQDPAAESVDTVVSETAEVVDNGGDDGFDDDDDDFGDFGTADSSAPVSPVVEEAPAPPPAPPATVQDPFRTGTFWNGTEEAERSSALTAALAEARGVSSDVLSQLQGGEEASEAPLNRETILGTLEALAEHELDSDQEVNSGTTNAPRWSEMRLTAEVAGMLGIPEPASPAVTRRKGLRPLVVSPHKPGPLDNPLGSPPLLEGARPLTKGASVEDVLAPAGAPPSSTLGSLLKDMPNLPFMSKSASRAGLGASSPTSPGSPGSPTSPGSASSSSSRIRGFLSNLTGKGSKPSSPESTSPPPELAAVSNGDGK